MEFSVALSIMFEIIRCPHSASELAEEFEVCTRTVYRYIDSLCGAGVPIISKVGRCGGFEIANYYRIKEFFLTKNEKQYLLDLLKKQNNDDSKMLSLKLNALATF